MPPYESPSSSFAPLLAAVLLGLVGCQNQRWPDIWQPIPAEKGAAWHNRAWQQTAFDADLNGRLDRLRFWIGSGLAEELIDEDFDGWFDTHLVIVYGKVRERDSIHREVPAIPQAGTPGSFELRKLLQDQ